MHEAPKLVRQEELLNLLLMHISLKQCAERIHLSYSTVRKYASEPDFLNNLRILSQSIYEEVISELKSEKRTLQDRLTEASDKALTKLEELLNSQQENVQLKAADSILDRTSETARNRKIEGTMQGRFTMDPITLMHCATTAEEIARSQTPEPPLKSLPSYEPDASAE